MAPGIAKPLNETRIHDEAAAILARFVQYAMFVRQQDRDRNARSRLRANDYKYKFHRFDAYVILGLAASRAPRLFAMWRVSVAVCSRSLQKRSHISAHRGWQWRINGTGGSRAQYCCCPFYSRPLRSHRTSQGCPRGSARMRSRRSSCSCRRRIRSHRTSRRSTPTCGAPSMPRAPHRISPRSTRCHNPRAPRAERSCWTSTRSPRATSRRPPQPSRLPAAWSSTRPFATSRCASSCRLPLSRTSRCCPACASSTPRGRRTRTR